ncbi:unnamed protein product [Durusdinium trenchii]|uniref:Uncharacterized protein n=1 Tax=Durusdinium trenchii TaxID=1381693 RepID=A0ABP0PJV2_9DINO
MLISIHIYIYTDVRTHGTHGRRDGRTHRILLSGAARGVRASPTAAAAEPRPARPSTFTDSSPMSSDSQPWRACSASMGYGPSPEGKAFARDFHDFLLTVEERPDKLEKVVERRRRHFEKQLTIDLKKLFHAETDSSTPPLQNSTQPRLLLTASSCELRKCERHVVQI